MWSGKGALKLQPANVWLDTGGGKKAYQELGDTGSQALAIGPTVWSFNPGDTIAKPCAPHRARTRQVKGV